MDQKEMSVFPTGSPNTAFAQYFQGQSYLNMLSTKQVTIGNVTFEPGCRKRLVSGMGEESKGTLPR